MSIFHSTPESPFHISVGAVLYNEEGKVGCHYFGTSNASHHPEYSNFYILMRESLESNETLEQAVARGLMEEFGATGKILDYIGSTEAVVPKPGYEMFKTTIYFLVELESFDENLRAPGDPERGSEIQWHPIDDLIYKMKQKRQRINRSDLDESAILVRAQQQLARRMV